MDEIEFLRYLKRTGRKADVIEKYVRMITHFERSFEDLNGIDDLDSNSLESTILNYEKKNRKVIKTLLYGLMLYYKGNKKIEMQKLASELRKARMPKKSPFPLKKILDIEPEHIRKLNDIGIKSVNDMIEAGTTKKKRDNISKKADVPYSVILELTKISDLIRLGYIKEKLSRLYYNAGIQTPADLSKWEAESLHKHFEEFVKETNWDGAVPFLSDLKGNIERAKKLTSIVEYE
ncbi:MAG: DUF4332 domain-containing protein [Candidatus Hodarchaeales archaeon]|jgi:hypothetical protein